jgi:hypothetical protein
MPFRNYESGEKRFSETSIVLRWFNEGLADLGHIRTEYFHTTSKWLWLLWKSAQ